MAVEEGKSKACIFMHSGSYDRVHQGFAIANVIVARGGSVDMLFAYGALRRLTKGLTDAPSVEDEPSSFEGDFKVKIERGAIDPISEMIKVGKQFGKLKLHACPGSMSIINITADDLIDDVDRITGLAGFMKLTDSADLVLYI
jgi:peroxiredoxin family protein